MKSVSIEINKDDDIHLQAHRGRTSLNGIGSEFLKFLVVRISFLLQLVSFTVDSDQLSPTRTVDTDTLHTRLLLEHFDSVHITLWLKVSHELSA